MGDYESDNKWLQVRLWLTHAARDYKKLGVISSE